MTISTSSSQTILGGNGATSTFNFSFIAGVAANIQVIYTDALSNQSVLSPSVYTLVLNAPSAGQIWGVGGSVTYPIVGSPIANGTSITIRRIVPITQTTSISNQGDFYPQVVEAAMDTLCLEIQQVAARTGQLRGAWATGLVYNFGDVVTDGVNGGNTGNFYMCAIQNTSGVWATDLAAGDWVIAYIGLTAANIAAVLGYTPMRGSNNLSEITNAASSRASLGLGSMATQSASAVAITGGTMSGVTITGHASLDLSIANNLSDVASASAARTNLGLGTIATQNANNVAITGGTLSNMSFGGFGIAPSYPVDILLSETSFVSSNMALRVYAAIGASGTSSNFYGANITASVDNVTGFASNLYGLSLLTQNTVAGGIGNAYGIKNTLAFNAGAAPNNAYGTYTSISSPDNTALGRFFADYTVITLPSGWSATNCGVGYWQIAFGGTGVSFTNGVFGLKLDDLIFPSNSSIGNWYSLYLPACNISTGNCSVTGWTDVYAGYINAGANCSIINFYGFQVGSITLGNSTSLINYAGIRIGGFNTVGSSTSVNNCYGVQIDSFINPASTGDGIPFYYNNGTAKLDAYGFWKDAGDSVVTTQFDKTTNTTLANITGLTASINANVKYKFRAVLHVTADGTGGHKYAIGGTAVLGSTGAIIFQVDSERNDTSAKVITSRLTALNGTGAGAAGGTTIFTVIEGEIILSGTGATAGTLTVQFAENASSGTSSVLVGSTFDVEIAG